MKTRPVAERIAQVQELVAAAAGLVSARALYEYALSKPADAGGAPPGSVGLRKADKLFTWKYRHGVVQYPRPLSQSTIDQYGLTPITLNDPAIIALALEHLYDDIVHFLIRKDTYVTERDGGLTEVGMDYRVGHRWYVQRLDRAGSPVGQRALYDNIDDVAEAVWMLLPASKRATYLDVFKLGI